MGGSMKAKKVIHYKKIYVLIVLLISLGAYGYLELILRSYTGSIFERYLQVIGAFILAIMYHGLSMYTFKRVKNQVEIAEATTRQKLYNGIGYGISSIVWGILNTYICVGLVVAILERYNQVSEWKLNVMLYSVVICIFYVSYSLSFQRKMYIKFTKKQHIEQALIYTLFFCVLIPSIFMTIGYTAKVAPNLENIIIVVNIIIAGVIAILVQGYKNAFNNSSESIYFGNFYQDSSTVLVLLATLKLNMEDPIAYQCTLIAIYVLAWFLRSNREDKKW
ncbi:V-type ATP synthase subunit I [Bacillus mycoides]|nr:V-type ATP synthase subunit I [Bacillus mycoides]